jgi:hypothetical protein
MSMKYSENSVEPTSIWCVFSNLFLVRPLFTYLQQGIVIMRFIRISRKFQEHSSQKPKFSMQRTANAKYTISWLNYLLFTK